MTPRPCEAGGGAEAGKAYLWGKISFRCQRPVRQMGAAAERGVGLAGKKSRRS